MTVEDAGVGDERAVVDKAVADLMDVLGPQDEVSSPGRCKPSFEPIDTPLTRSRPSSLEGEALVHYHQKANPVLRKPSR